MCLERGARRSRGARAGAAVLSGVLAAVPAAAGDAPAPDGRAVFEARCAGCHGPSGETDTPSGRVLKVRPLAGDAQLARMPVAALAAAIRANAKHRGVRALEDVGDAELRAAAGFVKELAARR